MSPVSPVTQPFKPKSKTKFKTSTNKASSQPWSASRPRPRFNSPMKPAKKTAVFPTRPGSFLARAVYVISSTGTHPSAGSRLRESRKSNSTEYSGREKAPSMNYTAFDRPLNSSSSSFLKIAWSAWPFLFNPKYFGSKSCARLIVSSSSNLSMNGASRHLHLG